MGKLSLLEIEERLKSPSLSDELREVQKHDQRVIFHTEPTAKTNQIPYYNEYLGWVRQILDEKKHDVFAHLLTLPIETVDFTEGVLGELRKALCAQDKNISFNLVSKELNQDFRNYIDGLNDEMFWESEAFSAMKSNINAVMIVDLPKLPVVEGELQQASKYANPYYYLLDPGKVVDAKVHRNGKMEWLIFQGKGENVYYAFDDDFFRLFIYKDNKIDGLIETPHELGYCPARMFWSTPFNNKSKFQRRGPVSNSLGKLDWLLFCGTASKHSTLYAGFPIYVMFAQKCGYKDADGNVCENGLVRKSVRVGNTDQFRMTAEPCPSCKDKKMLGPGTIMTAPAMRKADDPNLLDGVNVIGAQTEDLKWLAEYIEKQELNLQWNMIGVAREIGNDAAKNELQVSSGFESRMNVITWVATNFQIAHKWVLETVGRLRYGNAFMAANVNYGTKFYLYEADELIAEYDLSKKSGLPNFELSEQINQILNTKYRTNPNMMQRVSILKELEPYLNYNLEELGKQPGKVDERNLTLKKNFDDFISRFEREFMDVVSFMPFADFDTKISFIKEVLMGYVDELSPDEAETGVPDPATLESQASLRG